LIRKSAHSIAGRQETGTWRKIERIWHRTDHDSLSLYAM
jgi:hypothetical protein